MDQVLRHIKKGGSLAELTNRTVQTCYFLHPDRAGELIEIILGGGGGRAPNAEPI